MKAFGAIGAVTAVLSLSACLGAEPTEGELAARAFRAAVEDNGSFGENGVEGLRLLNATSGLNTAAPSAVPTTGSAVTFLGQIGIGNVETGLLGDLGMSVDFEGSEISATANNFVDADEVAATGSLSMASTPFDRNADPEENWMFNGTLQGTLTQQGIPRNIFAVMSGEFLGDGSYVSGEIQASPGNEGFFIAERVTP